MVRLGQVVICKYSSFSFRVDFPGVREEQILRLRDDLRTLELVVYVYKISRRDYIP